MLIGLTGFIGTGKNSVASFLIDNYDFYQDSYASTLKDICCVIFGWDREMIEGSTNESRVWREEIDVWWANKLGIPNFTPRLAMQLVGTDALRKHFHSDIWLLTLESRLIKGLGKDIVVSDARFINELQLVKKHNGVIINVCNDIKPEWYDVAKSAISGSSRHTEIMKEKYPMVHESEWSWLSVEPDFIIKNTGTLSDLEIEVDDIYHKLKK